MNSIDNLWDFDIRQNTDTPPKQVMEAQAMYLSEMSGGTIHASVQSSPGKGVRSETYVHAFKIGTHPPLEFEYKLFEVRQPIDIFPLHVSSESARVEADCDTLDQFQLTLKTILNAESTQRRLRALYAQAAGNVASNHANSGTNPPAPQVANPAPSATSAADAPAVAVVNTPAESAESTGNGTTAETVSAESNAPTEFEVASVPGDMSLTELKRNFNLEFNTTGYDTVGEFMRAELGSGTMTGARIQRSGSILEIAEIRGKHVMKVYVLPNSNG